MAAKKLDKKTVGLEPRRGPERIIDTVEGQAKIEKFIKYLGYGNYIETCCKISGIPKNTFYRWAEEARQGDPQYIELFQRVEEAMATAEADKVEVIRQAALAGDWKAAAWWLERMYRDRWSLDTKVIIESKVAEQVDGLIQQIQSLMPEEDFAQLMTRLNDDPDEKEDLVGKELTEATDVKDAEVIDREVDRE